MMRRLIPSLGCLALIVGCVVFPAEPDAWTRSERLRAGPVITAPAREGEAAGSGPHAPLLFRPAVHTFEAFLNLPEEKMDPALGALLFSAEDFPGLPVEPFLRYLDDLARTVRARARAPKGVEWIDAINQLLYFDLGFAYDAEDPTGVRPENLHLHKVIQRKKGYCVTLAVLYLGLARRLDLPVYGVRIPSHFILRYDDGKRRRNIETTDYGIAHPDRYYVRKYRIADACLREGIYLKNLSTRQMFADLLNNRGTLRGLEGNWRKSLRALNRGVRIDPRSPFLFYNRGVILSRIDREAEAVEDFRKALELDPNNVYAMNNLAEIHADHGRFEAALDQVNRALDIFPGYSNGYLNRGVIFHKMGKKALARENIDRALELDDRNAMAYIYRARLHRAQGRLNHAVYDLNRAVSAEPYEPQAWAERGAVHLARDRIERALSDFDRAVELAPGVMDYRLNRGVARLRAGDFESAREDFDTAHRLRPEHPEPLLKRAALALLEDRPREALRDLDRAVAVTKNDPAVLIKRGVAYQALDRLEEAEKDLRRAVELSPGSAEAHKRLGFLYRQKGEKERAIRHLETFLALENGDDPKGRAEAEKALETLRRGA